MQTETQTIAAPAAPPGTNSCPNCGFNSDRNFCAECGQPTHLHRETFWNLVTHSLAHYFHYDSKFLQTMRLLWFRPGALTLAYWRGQRARYLAPVALYLFISAIYFLTVFMSPASYISLGEWGLGDKSFPTEAAAEQHLAQLKAKRYDSVIAFIEYKGSKIRLAHPEKPAGEYLQEKFLTSLPRIYFFLVPVVALLLKLVFLRRKSLFYVDHAVFALHYQAFWFSVLFFFYLIPPLYHLLERLSSNAGLVVLGLVSGYLALALRGAYGTGWVRSIGLSLFIQVAYLALLACLSLLYLILYLVVF